MKTIYPIYFIHIDEDDEPIVKTTYKRPTEISVGTIVTDYGVKVLRHEPVLDCYPETVQNYCFTSEYVLDITLDRTYTNVADDAFAKLGL